MKAKIAVAKNSHKAGVFIDVIAEITSLSPDEIMKIQEEITKFPYISKIFSTLSLE